MSQQVPPLINPGELLLLQQEEKIILIDASAGAASKQRYKEKHLDHALYVDLDTQLADIKPDAANGGRHPLPTPEQFSNTLANLGITAASHVVIYDDKNGSNAASRLWWMLRSAGHANVQVLDGGFDAALKAGFPVNAGTEVPSNTGAYRFEKWLLPLAGINEVEASRLDTNFLVVDVRDHERFIGAKEPIDLVAGHIPGAINIPFSSNMNADGSFLSPGELRDKYAEAFAGIKPENIIVHCGSGVTACHTLLALAHAGMDIPKLYVGSWSEWSRNDRPVATIANTK